jgi:hypothetical protein
VRAPQVRAWGGDTGCMDRRPTSAGPPPALGSRSPCTARSVNSPPRCGPSPTPWTVCRLVAPSLHGDCRSRCARSDPGRDDPAPADRFISQTQLGRRRRPGAVLRTPLNSPTRTCKRKPISASAVPRSAGCSPRLPRPQAAAPSCGLPDQARRAASTLRIEPVAAELLLSAIDRARGTGPPRGWSPADANCGGSV